MSKPTQRVGEAVKIGKEMLAINEAISEASIAYGNAGKSKAEFWNSKLFDELGLRREILRNRLVELG